MSKKKSKWFASDKPKRKGRRSGKRKGRSPATQVYHDAFSGKLKD